MFQIQRGFGGAVGPRFPGTIASLKWWFSGDSLNSQADNSSVSAWTDESSAGKDVSNSDSGQWPVLHKNSLNGHSGVYFGGGKRLYNASQSLGNAITAFFVFNFSGTTIDGMWDTAPGSGNNIMNYGGGSTSQFDWLVEVPLFDMGLSAGTHQLCWEAYVTGGDTHHVPLWRDSSYISDTTAGSAAGIDWNNPGFGYQGYGGTLNNATLYETLWFNEVLDSTTRTMVEDYLNTKYGL
jgi:hypothetical protein